MMRSATGRMFVHISPKLASTVTYLEQNENSLRDLWSESTANPSHMTCQRGEKKIACIYYLFILETSIIWLIWTYKAVVYLAEAVVGHKREVLVPFVTLQRARFADGASKITLDIFFLSNFV